MEGDGDILGSFEEATPVCLYFNEVFISMKFVCINFRFECVMTHTGLQQSEL